MTTLAVQETHIIKVPEDLVGIRKEWVKSKEVELIRAEEALKALRATDASPARLERTSRRITLLRKVVKALQAGFIPIPRFASTTLRTDMEWLPTKVIIAVSEAKAQPLFDEFRIVAGQEGQSRQGPYGRRAQRDPLIVGVCRVPE